MDLTAVHVSTTEAGLNYFTVYHCYYYRLLHYSAEVAVTGRHSQLTVLSVLERFQALDSANVETNA